LDPEWQGGRRATGSATAFALGAQLNQPQQAVGDGGNLTGLSWGALFHPDIRRPRLPLMPTCTGAASAGTATTNERMNAKNGCLEGRGLQEKNHAILPARHRAQAHDIGPKPREQILLLQI